MISASADTLSAARRLQNEFGMDQRVSEGVAIAIHEHLIQNVATKDDLALLQAELEKRIEKVRGEPRPTVVRNSKMLAGSARDMPGELAHEFKMFRVHLWAMGSTVVTAVVIFTRFL